MGIPSDQFKRNRLPRYILTKEQADQCLIMGARYTQKRQLVWILRNMRNQHLDPKGVKLYEADALFEEGYTFTTILADYEKIQSNS